jgi:YD repeat-containing protein
MNQRGHESKGSGLFDSSIEISDPDATIEYTRDQLGRATTITNTIAGLT